MCKQRRQNFCPACDRYHPPETYQLFDSDKRPRCADCGSVLALGEPVAFGPYSQELTVAVLGSLARFLISAGLLDALADRARDEAPDDERAALLHARILLREAARL